MIGDREKYKKGQGICQKGTYTFAKSVRPLLTTRRVSLPAGLTASHAKPENNLPPRLPAWPA